MSTAVTRTLPKSLQPYAKAVVGFLGVLATILGTALQVGGVIPDAWLPSVHVLLGTLTVYGIYRVPNRLTPDRLAEGPLP